MITHLACIMDGNRRWAKQRGYASWIGHKEGLKSIDRTIDYCLKHNIKHLTLYTFSLENLDRRSYDEQHYLFDILAPEVKQQLIDKMRATNVRARIIGDRTLFPESMRIFSDDLERETATGTALTVYSLFCYGGRQEITAMVRAIANQVAQGTINLEDITLDRVANELWHAGIPDPELVIRTGGAYRLSNFLPFQTAYSELYFTDVFWPDVNEQVLDDALQFYQSCKRNFGV